jgi:YHS domain-containing protein
MLQELTFEERIKSRIQNYSESQKAAVQRLKAELEERRSRHGQFDRLASEALVKIICPRLERVAAELGDAVVTPRTSDPTRCSSLVHIGGQSPVLNMRLEIGLSLLGTNIVLYGTMDGEHHGHAYHNDDRTQLPLVGFSTASATAWVEERILQFVDRFLELRKAAELEIDPVCGIRVHKRFAAGKIKFGDRELYFCSDECMEQFRANPEGYPCTKPLAGSYSV